jgi:putative inorganic carbon (HCO3(-)) transporter
MRDVLVLAIVIASAPVSLFYPYFGIVMWTWIAYFNPHRFAYGMAYTFPVATVIAIPTIIGTVFTRERNRRFFTLQFFLLLALWGWFGVTTYHTLHDPVFVSHGDDTTFQLMQVSKILLMTIMSILLVNSEKKLRTLLIVTAFSFGALAVKGALFGLRTAGEFRVYGPPDSFVEDNNMLALAMNMVLPMMFFLARSEPRRLMRRLLWISFFCGIGGVLLSYSRGGLLGLATALGMIAIKTKRKVIAGILMVALAFLVLTFAPPAWMNRMSSFAHGNLDESAELRLNAWQFAWTLASQYPLTGGGFETFTPELYGRFTPALRFAGPHSIYFQMLGEQGFVGLGLFLLLVLSMLTGVGRLRRAAQGQPHLAWVETYAHIIQSGLIAYLVCGAFLARAYFDLFYLFVASTIILKVLYRREVGLQSQEVLLQPTPVDVEEAVLP